jgi:cell division protein FtsL
MMHTSNWKWISKVIVLLLVAAVLLLVPIMLQNRYSALTLREIGLRQTVDSLQGEVATRKLRNGELASLSRISDVVAEKGIGFNSAPVKLMATGRDE